MNRNLALPVTTLFFSSLLNAQTIHLTMKAVNKKNDPIPFVSFNLISRADTSKQWNAVADSSGQAAFDLQANGQYMVRVTSVNDQPLQQGITVNATHHSFFFTLEPLSKNMSEVVVTSKKPLMRQEDDKTIVDPENLVSSSTNAYEIMEKTPGLFVDQDGNIYLNGNTPVSIYINGRQMKMSNADIATMLKNLPPNSIQSIEILRTPSAKYDASGGGGIVNIILKKGVKLGLTGSINAGMNQGTYGNQFIGVTINNNTDTKHSYLNLNVNTRNSFERIKTDRNFAADTLLSQDAYTKYPGHSYYFGYGIGYDLGKKWEVNYDGRLSFNYLNNRGTNESSISKISSGQVLNENNTYTTNDGNSYYTTHGLNAKYKIDTTGSEWTMDGSFDYSHANNDQLFSTVYAGGLPSTGGGGNVLGSRGIGVFQSDVKWKFKNKITIESGIKSSLLGYHNATDYFKLNGSTEVKDNFRTNTYRYRENINAAYFQVSKGIKDIIIKAGTRLENTNMKGHQVIPLDTSFNIHRTDLFPYVYLSKKVMTIAGYDLRAYLVYRRTIARPSYENLNPFPRYVDQYLSEIGNPTLRPQFTQTYEANISVDERPLIAFGKNYTKDIFTQVVYQADSNRSISYRTYDNLGTNKEFYFRALGAIPPGGKYFAVVVAQYSQNFYEGLYENKPLSYKRGSWTFFTYHTLKIGKLSQLTVNGFIRIKGQLQFYELSTFGALNASINRQFMKRKLVVTVSANDIFYTNKNDFSITQGSVNARGTRYADTKRFGINLRYNFGIRRREENTNMFNVDSPENR